MDPRHMNVAPTRTGGIQLLCKDCVPPVQIWMGPDHPPLFEIVREALRHQCKE